MIKHYTLKLINYSKAYLLVGFLLVSGLSYGALSGTYTIDKGSAASSTNYQSFTSIFGDMYNGTRTDGGTSNGSGVSGPVVINVVSASGPYTEQFTIFQISGVSSTNTITLNGNGNAVQFTGTSTSAAHTILLNGADYIIIDNLVVRALGSSIGRGIHLMNDAQYNTISNCTVEMPNMTSTSSSNFYMGLTNGTTSTLTYGNAGKENTFSKNKMSAATGAGPYYGMVNIDESSGSTVKKNYFNDNVIKDFYYAGIFTYYAFQMSIIGNEIHNTGNSRAGVKYGMYNYCYNKGGDYIIENNYIHDMMGTTTQYGIYHYSYYGTGSGNLYVNNNRLVMKGLTTSAYGLYIYGYYSGISGNFSTNYNTIEMEKLTGSAAYVYGMYCLGAYYQTAFKAANIDYNLVKITSDAYAYGILGYIYYNSQLTKRGSISNNIVDCQINNSLQAGIYAYCYSNNQPIDVSYNTIYSGAYTSSTATKYLIYSYYVDGKVHNNNLICKDNGGNVYGIYDYYSTATFSNNNIYTSNAGATFSFGARNGSPVSDLASYKTTFADANGMSIDPILKDVNKKDYKPTSFNFVNKGVPVSGFTLDYNGVARNSTNPDVGALEYYVDVAVSKLYFTGSNVCGGYREAVKMTMKNNTGDTIKNVPVKFTITGKNPVKEFIPKVNPNDTIQYTFKTIAEFNGSGVNTLDVELDGTDDAVSNNKQSKNLNITPSPAGFELIESSTFPGYFRPGGGGGTKTNPDATIPGKKVIYEIAPNTSTGYSNSNYGNSNRWVISGTSFKTANGTTITGPVYTPPSGGSNATLSFDPSSSLIDSLIYLNLFVKNNTTGCDSSFGRWIYIPHIPVTSFQANDVCLGEVASFINKTVLGKGNVQYKWKFNDPGTPEDSSTLIDPIFNFSTYGNYKVVLSAYNAAFPKFVVDYSKTIVVTPVPTIDFKVLNACEKVALKFSNNTTLPIAGTITYNWNFGDPTTTLDKSTLKEPTWTYGTSGGYKVTLRATANGCSSELIKNANQYATPVAKWSAPSLICDKSEIQFTNNSTIKFGNMGYTWSFGDGGISNFSNPTHEYANATAKTVKLKAVSEFGCVDSSSRVITLSESPNADFTWGAACNLTNTSFNFTGTKPASPIITTFNWNFAGEGTTTLENPSKLFSIVGKKKVTLTLVSNNGCSDIVTKDVNVKLQSKADFESIDVCEDDDAVFTNTSVVTAGNLNYNWKFGDGNNSSAQSPRHRYNIGGTSQTFNVTLVAVVPGGCSDSITKAVTVNASPDASFTFTKSGRQVYFKANQAGATLYNWRFGDGGSATTASPAWHYTNFPSGNYVACLALVNAAGCFNETCQTIAITGGVDKLNKLTGVKLYPNPNKGNFEVTVEDPKSDISIVIYNLLGDVVKTVEANPLKSVYAIDLNVANGVYLVKVTNGGLVSTQKVTVNK